MFFRSKDPKEKKLRKIDRLVKGLIIGGAVGSVIGITLAPKAGRDTRKILADSSKFAFDKGKALLDSYTKKEESDTARKPSSNFLRGIRALIFGRKK